MANIKQYTDQIAQAVYGEEVRGSIINALNKINDDVDEQVQSVQEATSALDTAISNATTAKSQLSSATSTANTAQTNLSGVISTANQALTQLEADIATGNQLASSLETKNTAAVQNINDLNDATFSSQEILVGVEDLKAYLGYVDEDIVGVQIDYKNKTSQRLAGAYNLTGGVDFDKYVMFGGRKRCNVANDGTIVAYHGDEDYTEDGTMGQVMVYQPAFWYKVVPLVYDKNTTTGIGYHLRKANYYVSSKPTAGFRLHPAFYDANGNELDYILLSAYEGSMWDDSADAYVNDNIDTSIACAAGDLLCSVAGKKPISGLRTGMGTKANFENMALNRGSGWHLETIKAASANQLLMIIEMGTMNTQTAIGQGVVSVSDNSAYNCASLTGSTASIGNGTGQATETTNEIGGTETAYTASGKLAVTYRGVENPWGNLWKHVNGVNLWGNGSMGGGQPYIANDFTFNESKNSDNYEPVGFTLANTNGYISAMGYGGEEYDWLLMPSECLGTSALPVGDHTYVTSNLTGYRIAQLGGAWSNGSGAGGFFWGLDNGVGGRHRNLGARLVYVPTKAAATSYASNVTAWNQKMLA